MSGLHDSMHTTASNVQTMSANVSRLGDRVETLARLQSPIGMARTPRAHAQSSSSPQASLVTNHDNDLSGDDGDMADVETPLPVPRKARTGPKLRGVPTKRDPERKALLVRLYFHLLKEATYLT